MLSSKILLSMKIGTITTTNAKGQIVIPKKMRDALGITEQAVLNVILADGGIYIYPVQDVMSSVKGESSYASLLEKTKGAWQGDDWGATQAKRAATELKASESRKNAW